MTGKIISSLLCMKGFLSMVKMLPVCLIIQVISKRGLKSDESIFVMTSSISLAFENCLCALAFQGKTFDLLCNYVI